MSGQTSFDPKDGRTTSNGEAEEQSSTYLIYDDNNTPLVIDLDAIDECQKHRMYAHRPPRVTHGKQNEAEDAEG